MNIGVVYPQTEFGNDPTAIKDYAQTAEALGYSHILAYDHILSANPDRPGWSGLYTHEHPFLEPFVLFSYISAVTSQIGFTTGILILPQRQTALVAKQAASLDLLCNGRLRLGFGVGWNEPEFVGLNENFKDRGRRIEEQVELLRLLWTKPLITYSGKWHHIPDAGLNPLPVQRPIPIWFGGDSRPVMHRIARLGDGWMPNYRTVEQAQSSLDILSQALVDEGRSMDQIGIEARLKYADGKADRWQRIMDEWIAVGADYFSINTMGCGFSSPGEHIEAITHFAEAMAVYDFKL
jgi:probable F420-dependent oxidoreductase